MPKFYLRADGVAFHDKRGKPCPGTLAVVEENRVYLKFPTGARKVLPCHAGKAAVEAGYWIEIE